MMWGGGKAGDTNTRVGGPRRQVAPPSLSFRSNPYISWKTDLGKIDSVTLERRPTSCLDLDARVNLEKLQKKGKKLPVGSVAALI
jgi:hypothetical protein